MGKYLDRYMLLFIGVAIVAVLISKQSNTANVIQSFGAMLTNVLGAIVSPISNSGTNGNNGLWNTVAPASSMTGATMADTPSLSTLTA
jgi:hypothetical protein